MPSIDDIIQLRLRSEQQGVLMQNTLHYIMETDNSPTVVAAAMTEFATQFVDAFRPQLSIQWALTCILYGNITDDAEADQPAFMTEAGSEVTVGPHPSSQVVNCTRYAVSNIDGTLKHGSIKLSGLHKDVSKTGRVESDMELGTLEAFLRAQVSLLAGAWLMRPVLQYTGIVGPPPVLDWADVQQVIVQGVFSKLRSRTSSLCATA